MRPRHVLLLAPLSAAALLSAQHAPRHPSLRARVSAVLQQPAVAGAHWGVSVVRMDGTPLLQLDDDRLFRPASTAKLFTTAAALSHLGPDSTVETTVTGTLDSTTGTVTGDLILHGAGDPAFNTRDLPYTARAPASPQTPQDLATLAAALQARGIRHITGNIAGDDQLFTAEPPPPGWADEDLVWGYGALPAALSTNDNEATVHITADPGGTGPATVTADPAMQLQIEVNSLPEHTEAYTDAQRTPGSTDGIRLFGSVAVGSPITEHLALPDPALTAASLLREQLQAQNITADGTTQARHTPPTDATPFLQAIKGPLPCIPVPPPAGSALAKVTSAPLWQDVIFTLKTSANLHAETMLRRLALTPGCTAAVSTSGLRAVHETAQEAGVVSTDLVLYDGSGLSTKDLVTPRAETDLLVWATRQPWFAHWQAALPVGGVDGTLAHRFTTGPLTGRVLAKTGTLGESRALAGYLQCTDGSRLAFAILVDDHLPGTPADREAMDGILATVAQNARGTAAATAACVP